MSVISRALSWLPTWLLRAAHDLGLAAWFGGAYMGAVALNGASREVDDPTQRSRVANAGWFRWAAIVPVAVTLHLAGGIGLTQRSGGARQASETASGVARVTLLATAMAATAESGRSGRTMTRAGDVPVATAVQSIADTPEDVRGAQRSLRIVQWVIPVATGGMIVVDAWQQSHGGTRVLPHRWLGRIGLG